MATPLRILILEDQSADAELMVHELRRAGFALTWQQVDTEADFLARLEPAPDVILADYTLPQYDASRALRQVRERGLDTPFIVVTGSISEEVAVECMKQGVSDYLLKNRLTRLGQAVTRAMEQKALRDAQQQADARIRHLNELLLAIRSVNRLSTRERNPELLLSGACRLLVQTRGYRLVWIGRIAAGEARILPVAFAGDAPDSLETIRLVCEASASGPDPTGTALRTRRPATVQRPVAGTPGYSRQEPGLALSAAAIPLLHAGECYGALTVQTDRSQAFDAQELDLLGGVADDLALTLRSIADQAQRIRAETALAERSHQLEAVRAVTTEIAVELDLPTLLALITRRACELVGVESGCIFLWDSAAEVLVPRAHHGDIEWIQEVRLRLGEGVVGTVALRREGLLVNDYRQSPYALSRYVGPIEGSAILAEPLLFRDRLLGVLALSTLRLARPFTREDCSLLTLFAGQAAIAIENAQLFGQVQADRRRLADLSRRLVEVQESERRFIATELHDQIGQELTALRLSLELTGSGGKGIDPKGMAEAQELVKGLLARVRNLSLDLRPAMLDDLGLLAALIWYLDQYRSRTGIAVALKYDAAMQGWRFPAELETAAYRVVQEALTNVARHAGVDTATVHVWAGAGGCLGVRIEDGGKGFDPAAALAAHASSGIAGMRERVGLLEGRFTIESSPGSGTRVEAEFPVPVICDADVRLRCAKPES